MSGELMGDSLSSSLPEVEIITETIIEEVYILSPEIVEVLQFQTGVIAALFIVLIFSIYMRGWK